ncbi:MAG: ABC transporter permease [Candidatus Rokubacteria bacterium]|nr:ABC transporter permease [Candidatus Rokubacteria bacterium]
MRPSAAAVRSTLLGPLPLIALFIGAWWLAVVSTRSLIVPTPWQVGAGLVELAREGLLIKHVTSSLYRVLVGYLIAAALAIPLGICMGWFKGIFTAVNPLIQILRPISPIAWIPLAIIWFGVGDFSPMFLIFLSAFFPMVVNATTGAHTIDQQYIRAARNFGVSGLTLFRLVVFPAAVPHIIVGMRVSLGVAWLVLVAAEMIALNSGLGFLIMDSRNAGNRYDLVVAGMVLIGVFGLLLDGLIRRLEGLKEVRWRYGR